MSIYHAVDYVGIHINSVGNTNAVVRNNIVYDTNGDILNEMSGGGGATISNNITTNPSFVSATTSTTHRDRTANNFKLAQGSNAIDACADLSASGVTDDMIGTARPQNGTYDCGAYEYIVASGGPTASGGAMGRSSKGLLGVR